MTGDETKLILRFLRGCYPAFYRNMNQLEKDCVWVAWSTLFADDYYTYDDVFEAVKKCVTGELRVRDGMGTREVTDGGYRRFPPQPGVIAEALDEGREIAKYALRLREEHRKRGYYAQRLKAECEAEGEQRRLRARECECLPGGIDDGQQDENRVVYAYVEPGHGMSAGLPVLLRPGDSELLRDERVSIGE